MMPGYEHKTWYNISSWYKSFVLLCESHKSVHSVYFSPYIYNTDNCNPIITLLAYFNNICLLALIQMNEYSATRQLISH